MIIITEKSGNIGVFNSVIELQDRLVCDNIELPYNVIGNYEISEDNTLLPPPPVIKIVPESIAMWQARDIMIKHGILDDVINFINSIPEPIERKRAQSKFEFSNTVRRDDSLLNFVATQAGYTKDQIDDWFIEGEKL